MERCYWSSVEDISIGWAREHSALPNLADSSNHKGPTESEYINANSLPLLSSWALLNDVIKWRNYSTYLTQFLWVHLQQSMLYLFIDSHVYVCKDSLSSSCCADSFCHILCVGEVRYWPVVQCMSFGSHMTSKHAQWARKFGEQSNLQSVKILDDTKWLQCLQAIDNLEAWQMHADANGSPCSFKGMLKAC